MITLHFNISRNYKGKLLDESLLLRAFGKTLKSVSPTIMRILRINTPVDTRELQNNWAVVRKTQTHYRFQNPTPYGYVVDEGRFRGVGPKTRAGGPVYTKYGRGIFSTQALKGITYPYFHERGDYIEWLRDLITKRYTKFFRRLS